MQHPGGRRIDDALARFTWLRSEGIWPAGRRSLWTDAHGLLLLVSLHRLLGETRFLAEARRLVTAVESALGPELGSPPGAAAETGVEHFQPLAMWIFALGCLARFEPAYRSRAIELARAAHQRFAPRGLACFLGYAACRSLDDPGLSAEVAELHGRIERSYRDLVVTQDDSVGMMLWLTHLHPEMPWAELQRSRCLRVLEHLWVDPPGYFCREPGSRTQRSAAANHGISIGLQAVAAMPERVEKLRSHFRELEAGQDRRAITHVLACCADLPGGMS
jgi:hypothetical protein